MNHRQTRLRRDVKKPAPAPRDISPAEDLVRCTREFARQRPEIAALACLCAGFILGWRLKPW